MPIKGGNSDNDDDSEERIGQELGLLTFAFVGVFVKDGFCWNNSSKTVWENEARGGGLLLWMVVHPEYSLEVQVITNELNQKWELASFAETENVQSSIEWCWVRKDKCFLSFVLTVEVQLNKLKTI